MDRYWTSRTRHLAVAAIAALVPSLVVVGATASPASASCTHTHSNKDSGNDIIKGATSGLTLRPGPHRSCGSVKVLPNNGGVDLWCYTYNGDEVTGWDGGSMSTWSFVRYNNGSGDYYGWLADAFLAAHGSTKQC